MKSTGKSVKLRAAAPTNVVVSRFKHSGDRRRCNSCMLHCRRCSRCFRYQFCNITSLGLTSVGARFVQIAAVHNPPRERLNGFSAVGGSWFHSHCHGDTIGAPCIQGFGRQLLHPSHQCQHWRFMTWLPCWQPRQRCCLDWTAMPSKRTWFRPIDLPWMRLCLAVAA